MIVPYTKLCKVPQNVQACIVRSHKTGGLFAQINKVFTCLELYPRVSVDFEPQNSPYRAADVENLWDLIFDPIEPSPLPGEPVDTMEEYPHSSYTHRSAADTYIRQREGWRVRLHYQWNRLRLKPEVKEIADSIFPERIRDCISVLYRGDVRLAKEQRTGVLPSPELMCERVNEVSTTDTVFVSADSLEADGRFREILGERMIRWDETDRAEKIGETVHHITQFGSDHVRKMLALAIALSRTKHFVHAVSNIATCVMYINPWLSDSFVETKRR